MILQAHPNVKGIASLPYFSMQELMELSGVGIVKASQILALAEISKEFPGKMQKSICVLILRSPLRIILWRT